MKKIKLTKETLLEYLKLKDIKELTGELVACLIGKIVSRKDEVLTIKEIVLNRSEDKSIWGISFIGDTLKFVLEFKDPTGSGIWGDVILFFKTNQQKATVFYSYAGSPEYSPGSYWVQLKYNGELNGDVIDDLMLRAYKHGKKQHNSKNITITGILKH